MRLLFEGGSYLRAALNKGFTVCQFMSNETQFKSLVSQIESHVLHFKLHEKHILEILFLKEQFPLDPYHSLSWYRKLSS